MTTRHLVRLECGHDFVETVPDGVDPYATPVRECTAYATGYVDLHPDLYRRSPQGLALVPVTDYAAPPPERSRADRAGQLVVVLVVALVVGVLIGMAVVWAWPRWWSWLIAIVGAVVWVLLAGTGIAASLDKTTRSRR